MKVVVLSVCLLLIALISTAQGDYTVTVTPSWGACYGAKIPNTCNFYSDSTTNPVTSIVSWGTPGPGEPFASRVRLQGPGVQSVPGGGYFLLSKITHDNYLIQNGSIIPNQIGVSWSITLQDPSAANPNIGTFPFSGTLNVNETLNSAFGDSTTYCPYASSWLNYGYYYSNQDYCCPYPTPYPNKACSDSLTAVLDSASTTQTISPPGTTLTYKMIVAGFCDQPTTDGCSFATSFSFISQEEQSNVKYLFGQLVVSCNPNSDTCQQAAAAIDPCRSGYCSGQVCVFGAIQNKIGTSCTPTNPAPCQDNYKCQTYQGFGACIGTQSANGASCPSNLSPTPCTRVGCNNGACQLIPLAQSGTQCIPYSGATNSSCSSFTCQASTGGLPTCQINAAAEGGSCSDAGSVPSGYSSQCITQGCHNGKCSWIATNDGQSCGSSTTCSISRCSGGACVAYPESSGSHIGCSATDGTSPVSPCQSTYCNGAGQCTSGGQVNQGQSCGTNTDCASFSCNNGQCQKFAKSGSCNSGQTPPICQAYVCDGNGNCGSQTLTGSTCYDSRPFPNNCTEKRCSSSATCDFVPKSATNNYYGRVNCGQNLGECQYSGCDGNGNCNVNYIQPYDYNPCSLTKPSDCQKYQCTGSSTTCQIVADPSSTNCNDPADGSTIGNNQYSGYCTYGKCNSGQCIKNTVSDGASCNQPAPTLAKCQLAQCSSGTCAATNNVNGYQSCNSKACTIPYCNGNFQCTYDRYITNGTACSGQSGQTGFDNRCAAEKCDGQGNCNLLNYADFTSCLKRGSDPNPGQCQSYHCKAGSCILDIDITQSCGSNNGDEACYSHKCTTSGGCAATPDDTLSCSGSSTYTLDACHVWGCRNGTCMPVPGNQGAGCTVSSPNQCMSYSCQWGTCTGTVKYGIPCNYANLPVCNRAFCNTTGTCDITPIPDNGSCVPAAAQGNDCDVRVCKAGSCVDIDQSGKNCNVSLNNFCSYATCSGKTCGRVSRNENTMCNPSQTNVSKGDGFCQRQICKSGVCTTPGNYFSNETCGRGVDPCTYVVCAGGYCDQTQTFPSPAGTNCGSQSDLQGCTVLLCDGNGQCRQNAADGRPCTDPQITYKKRDSGPNQCQAYTCGGGICTPTIKNVDGIPCVGNFTDPCTVGVCTKGDCKPGMPGTSNANCSSCGQFKNCKTCLGGSFASKRDQEISACRLNPNLKQCQMQCSWCNGQCFSSSQVDEYNQYYPQGSTLSLTCEDKCPAVLVVTQSSSIGRALGLGLGLGLGGLLLLALLAAAALVVFLLLKRRANTLDSTALETAFVKNKQTEVNPMHEKQGQPVVSQAYAAGN